MFALIEEWKQSNEPRKAFCQKHGLAPSTFSYWYSQYQTSSDTGKRAGSFMKIHPQLPESLEVIYPNGVRVLLPRGTSPADLRALIQLV